MNRIKLVTALAAGLIVSTNSFGAIVPFSPEPDCQYWNCDFRADIGFDINFFGNIYSEVYVDVNGYVSPGGYEPLGYSYKDYLEWNIDPMSATMISPFWNHNSNMEVVSWGKVNYEGNSAFAVNWFDMRDGGYNYNNVQLIIVDRSSDFGVGDFDFIFNYGTMQWISEPDWGGESFVGYAVNGNFYGHYYGSEVNMAEPIAPLFAPISITALTQDIDDRSYVLEVRNGIVTNPFPLFSSTIPEPETWAMLLAGLGIVGAVHRKRRATTAYRL